MPSNALSRHNASVPSHELLKQRVKPRTAFLAPRRVSVGRLAMLCIQEKCMCDGGDTCARLPLDAVKPAS